MRQKEKHVTTIAAFRAPVGCGEAPSSEISVGPSKYELQGPTS